MNPIKQEHVDAAVEHIVREAEKRGLTRDEIVGHGLDGFGRLTPKTMRLLEKAFFRGECYGARLVRELQQEIFLSGDPHESPAEVLGQKMLLAFFTELFPKTMPARTVARAAQNAWDDAEGVKELWTGIAQVAIDAIGSVRPLTRSTQEVSA